MDENKDLEKEYIEFMQQSLSTSAATDRDIEGISTTLSDSLSGKSDLAVETKKSKLSKFLKKVESTSKDLIKYEQDVGEKKESGKKLQESAGNIDDLSREFIEGQDTHEEKEDMERFFKNFENGKTSPHDYSLLNKNLSASGPQDTDHSVMNPGPGGDFVEHQQENLKSGSDSNSDPHSEAKSRILEAINRMSLTSSGTNSVGDFKTKLEDASIKADKIVDGCEDKSEVIIGENIDEELSVTYGDIEDFERGSHHGIFTSTKKLETQLEYDSGLKGGLCQGMELQRIEDDCHELKNRIQNKAAVEIVDEIKETERYDGDALQVKILELEAQLRHQELLIQNYQEDNKKLYQQSKKNKITESDNDHLIQENFRLKNEMNILRKEMDRLKLEASRAHQKTEDVLPRNNLELEKELQSALISNSELRSEVNALKTKLKEGTQVFKTAYSRNMSPRKAKPSHKSLIPILSLRDGIKASLNEGKNVLVEYLEDRVRILEEELRKKIEEEDERLQLLQREFINVKVQYQEHLQLLENQFEQKQVDLAGSVFCSDPGCSAKMQDLERTITRLRKELCHLKDKNDAIANEDLEKLHQETNDLKKENFDLKFQVSSIRNKYEADTKALRAMHEAMQANQEIQARQLEESARQSRTKLEELNALTNNYKQLELHVKKLKEDLREAKRWHSPKLKPLEEINVRIHDMKEHLNNQERQLNDLIKPFPSKGRLEEFYEHSIRELEAKHQEERNKWRSLVLEKVNEIQYFRQQLDIVLSFMKTIKQRGIVNSVELMPLNALKAHVP